MELLPKRKPNRLTGYDYSQPGCYFITICTAGRQPILRRGASVRRIGNSASSKCGEITERAIQSIPNHYPYVFVEKYVVMPNHIHLMLRIEGTGRTLCAPTPVGAVPRIIKAMKETVTQMCQVSRLASRPHRPRRGGLSPHLELHRHESCRIQVAGGLLLLPE